MVCQPFLEKMQNDEIADIFNIVGVNCTSMNIPSDISTTTNGYHLVFDESTRNCKSQEVHDDVCNKTSSLNENVSRLCNCKTPGM